MDSTAQCNEMARLVNQMLAILQRNFPLPACIQADMITDQIFLSHGSSSLVLTNGIIYYLICIADPAIGRSIQWPVGTQSQAKFNQTIIKAITNLCKDQEAFHLSYRTSLGSILRDRKGPKFDKFIFELTRNALSITNTNHGSRAVPQISSDVPVDDRVEMMRRTTDKVSSFLAQKRNSATASQQQDVQLLEQLEQKKIDLKKRSEELINTCPSKYTERMNANRPVQENLLGTNQWQADLNGITNEQARRNNLLTSYNNSIDAIKTIIRDKLSAEDLVNDRNGPIIIKTANENNIEVTQGSSISLPGFIESSSIITEKLKTLVINKEFHHLADDFSVPLERSANTLSKMNQEISDGEQLVLTKIEQGKELRKVYEEGVAAEGGHEFPLPDLELEIRVDVPPAPYSPSNLIQSPGVGSPKRVLEEARRRRRDAADGAGDSDDSVGTPKVRGASQRNHANSSLSQLTKSVLQKQTLSSTLASHANSTVGDMIPLSSSSPVSMRGNTQNPPAGPAGGSRPARTSLADVLNELEESNLSFWDLSEESSVMNSSFDSPAPPMVQPPRGHVHEALAGPSRVGSRLPVPLTCCGETGDHKPVLAPSFVKQCPVAPSAGYNGRGTQPMLAPSGSQQNGQSGDRRRPSTAPATAPARPPRRSIQNLIDRLQRIKANSTNAEVRDQLQ